MVATPVQIGPSPNGPTTGTRTLRLDRWWVNPLATAAFLGILTGYAIWAGFQTSHFAFGSYISPLYSPCVAADCGSRANVVIIGSWWKWSPALLVMAVPIGVRATCYYYRKLYYRSFWLSPPACAVAEPHRSYSGETRLPLILQNVHRYFWALSVLVAAMLTYDAINAFRQPGGIGVGVGTGLIVVNAAAFWCYVLSCHSCRHLVGGGLRSQAKHLIRHRLWDTSSRLNSLHGLFALISLPLVMVTDGYIRLVSSGVVTDAHLTVFR
jgi:hypothetical protein